MEIRVYNPDFSLKKILENYSSLLWKRCYNDIGSFSITCPATTDNINALMLGRIIWIRGKPEAGVIESRTLAQSERENSLIVSGRFLESYMDRRLIKSTYNFSGTVENAMREILTNADLSNMIELEDAHDWTDEVEFQATYKNVLDYEKKLAKSAAYGFRFRPDFVNKKITFEIYQGADHSINQRERPRVTFSEEYTNMLTSTYAENDQLYKNVIYVAGEGNDWRDREIIIAGDDSLTGLERREVFSDSSDVTSNGLTMAQYRAALIQRGNDILESCVNAHSFSCATSPNSNFVYGKNYDVGDIVTVQKESWNVSEDLRVIEVTEIYERGLPVIEPVFGTILPETINWEE